MSAMPWVKLHTEILGDEKLMRAARKGAKRLDLLPWLIAFAAKAGDDGRLTVNGEPAEPQDIAEKIPGVRAISVEQCIESCRAIDILVLDSDGSLRFAAWKRRAGKPSDLKESVLARVHRHREKKAQVVDAEGTRPTEPLADATPAERTATPMKRVSKVLRNAIEVEGEEEEERRGRLRSEHLGTEREPELSDADLLPPASPPAPPSVKPKAERPPPPGVRAFLRVCYDHSIEQPPSERVAAVLQELRATLMPDGAPLEGDRVRAFNLAHLNDVCRSVADKPPKKRGVGMHFVLLKLRDTYLEVKAAAEKPATAKANGRGQPTAIADIVHTPAPKTSDAEIEEHFAEHVDEARAIAAKVDRQYAGMPDKPGLQRVKDAAFQQALRVAYAQREEAHATT